MCFPGNAGTENIAENVNVDILDSQLRLNGFVFIAEILKKARELEVAGMAKKTAAITAWQETLR